MEESAEPESTGPHNPLARGFVVGTVGLCLLLALLLHHVLIPELATHAREFALLGSLGYGPVFLCSVVVWEALLLVLLAFVPAALLLPAVYALARLWTGLPLVFGWPRLGTVLLLTLSLAILVALWGCRKVRGFHERELWDPSDLF